MTIRGWLTFAAAGAALIVAGCSSTSSCNRDEETVDWAGGFIQGDTYFSSAYQDPDAGAQDIENPTYQFFPPNRKIRFLHNQLGGTAPPHINPIQLAFSERGTIAPSAGNETIVTYDGIDETDVKNDTCSTFYIFLTVRRTDGVREPANSDAGAPVTGANGSAGAAGSDDGSPSP